MGASDLRSVGERLAHLLEELRAIAEPAVWERAEEAVGLVTELYGEGLTAVVGIARSLPAPEGDLVLGRMVDDDLVASLMILHGLHPLDMTARVERALERVRPYLGSHGGDMQVLDVDEVEGVVRLRLLGSCDGCPSSSVTLELAVRQAIEESAPDVVRIDVEGVDGEPVAAHTGHAEPDLPVATPVQLSRKPPEPAPDEPLWQPVYGLHGLVAGRVEQVEIEGQAVVFCRVGKEIFAYRNACPECAGALHGGRLVGESLACPSCGASFDVRLAGRSLDGKASRLDAVPLVHEGGGTVRVAVAAGAAR